MANLAETKKWEDGIYQLEEEDLVKGGADGIDNVQAKQLANRTLFLKAQIESLGSDKQDADPTLAALAALSTEADLLIYSTGVDTFSTTSLTAFMRMLLGSASATTARTALGAAASGANGDITSLTGLTTALSIAQGGTGATSAAEARTALGAVASGANSDITSLSGLTTALSIDQGGTGATNAAAARAALGAASTQDIETAIAALVDSSPAALNTLNELADALGNDANFAATVTAALSERVTRSDIQNTKEVTSVAGGLPDAITAAFSPAITTVTNGMKLHVRAAVANTTTVPTFTPNSGTVAAKTIVKLAGTALAAGDIAGAGHWLELQYDATLDKWVLLNPTTTVSSTSTASVQGGFKNLIASASGTSVLVTDSIDEIVVGDGSGAYKTLRAVALSINSAASGANGLDTGTLNASTWYSRWVIYNPTTQTTAGLLSLSATSPTLPSGYTHKARVGWIRTDATNKYPLSFKQYGRRVQYAPAASSNLLSLPLMVSGTIGDVNTPTWSPVGVSDFIPSTAARIHLVGFAGGSDDSTVMVAPNANYGKITSQTNPPPLSANSSPSTVSTISVDLNLEASNIFAATYGLASITCLGWEDNL